MFLTCNLCISSDLFILSSTVVIVCTICFNIQNAYILSTMRIYAFRMVLRIDNDFFSLYAPFLFVMKNLYFGIVQNEKLFICISGSKRVILK